VPTKPDVRPKAVKDDYKEGCYEETSRGRVSLWDPYHIQRSENVVLSELSETALLKVVSDARRRIEIEIDIARDKLSLRQDPKSVRASGDRKVLGLFPGRQDYAIGNSQFAEVGIGNLALRAKERFFSCLLRTKFCTH
jgi:hypothetical protein